MATPSEVGDRILMCRTRLRFSQQQIADLVGIAPAQYYRYEAGRNIPRAAMADRLAEALGVSTRWLLTGDGPMERDPADDTGMREESDLHVINVEFTKSEARALRRHAQARGMTPEQLMKLLMYQQFESNGMLDERGDIPTSTDTSRDTE